MRDMGLLLQAPRLPCMETESYRELYALLCPAPPVRRVGQFSAAVLRYLFSPLPVECNHFTCAKSALAGEVTLLGGCAGHHCSEQT